jgi:hypothetical protein
LGEVEGEDLHFHLKKECEVLEQHEMNALRILEQPWSEFAVFHVESTEGVYLYF